MKLDLSLWLFPLIKSADTTKVNRSIRYVFITHFFSCQRRQADLVVSIGVLVVLVVLVVVLPLPLLSE